MNMEHVVLVVMLVLFVSLVILLAVVFVFGVMLRHSFVSAHDRNPFFGVERKDGLFLQEEDSTDFETPMRKLLLDSLEQIRIEHINLRYCPLNWNERLKEVLSLAIKIGVLSEIVVRKILDIKLREAGRFCFEDHLRRGTYPDHTFWPEALAYALRENEFSPEEMEKICFDHGDTVGTFIQGYGKKDLLDVAFIALLPD